MATPESVFQAVIMATLAIGVFPFALKGIQGETSQLNCCLCPFGQGLAG
jgi:hypothetical protein